MSRLHYAPILRLIPYLVISRWFYAIENHLTPQLGETLEDLLHNLFNIRSGLIMPA